MSIKSNRSGLEHVVGELRSPDVSGYSPKRLRRFSSVAPCGVSPGDAVQLREA